MTNGHAIWTPDAEQLLAKMYLEGRSHTVIAHELTQRFGRTVSRNASIGKAARMGLVPPTKRRPGKPLPPNRVVEKLAKARPAPVSRPDPDPVALPANEPAAFEHEPSLAGGRHLLSLFELKASSCRFPMTTWHTGGAPSPTDRVYCGRPKIEGASHSYCDEHGALCCTGRVNLAARGAGFRLAIRG